MQLTSYIISLEQTFIFHETHDGMSVTVESILLIIPKHWNKYYIFLS